MKPGVDEKFLKHLLSKRKEVRHRRYPFSWLAITPAEREKLYEAGEQCGLLTTYEFSGIKASGTSRNDAANRLLDKTHERAFTKLKAEFGSKAHFWVKPEQLSFLRVGFYWRLARIGVVITGPPRDDLYRFGPARTRDSCNVRQDFLPPNLRGLTLLSFPYYVVWHHPFDFVSQISGKLIASERYPRLSEKAPG